MSVVASLIPVVLFSFFILFVFGIIVVIFAFYSRKGPVQPQSTGQEKKTGEPPSEEE